MKYIITLIFTLYSTFIGSAMANQSNTINLFSETFGDKKNPAIILNAGAGNQAITWPAEFCNKLATKGYFVIRYDYRDTGLSSETNYELNPYNVMDLANDAIKILDKYHVEKAHFVGFSMGGQLAQFVGAYIPSRALSIILIGTSTDFMPGFNAFENIWPEKGLSAPDRDYIKWQTSEVDFTKQSLDERVNDYIYTWRLLDGNPSNFDEEFFKKQGYEVFTRTTLNTPYISHAKAMKASLELHSKAPMLIKVPTLILQGEKDPVFPLDHGEDLHKKILNSKLVIMKDMGHAISPRNFDSIISNIDSFIKKLSN